MLALRRGLLIILSVGYANTLSLGYFKSTTLFLYILESTKQGSVAKRCGSVLFVVYALYK